jgi:hypothetical protein
MTSLADPMQSVVAGDRLEDYDGLRLLISDIRTIGKLLNEARYLTTERLFGVSREDSALVTIVAVGSLVAVGQQTAAKLTHGPPLPELGNVLLSGAGISQVVHGIGGETSAEIPGFAALVVLTVVATSIRPVVSRSWHGARTAAHATRMGFDHRYGHIIRPLLRLR